MAADARLIGPVDRLLYLKATAGLDGLGPDDLYAIAQHFQERFFRKGSLLLEEGTLTDRFFLLVEGEISLRRGGRTYRVMKPPGTAGFLSAISQHPAGTEARAEDDCLVLEMKIDDLHSTLEDSFDLLITLVRNLTGDMAQLQRKLELEGLLTREEPAETPYPERPLDLVQRLVIMRRGGPFQNASLNPLAELAERAIELRLPPGTVLWEEGDSAEYGINIVHGVVSCAGDGGRRQFRMGPGSVLGTLETLAQLPRSYRAVTETRVVGLRGNMEVLLDILEDNAELGRAFLEFLASALEKLFEKAADLEQQKSR
jgi:CRP-like cAMP-binding protein